MPDRPEADVDVLVRRLEVAFHQLASAGDPSHDISHCRRVCKFALAIAGREGGAEERVLVAAAYLHDIVNLPKNHPDRARASTLSAEAAAPLLREIGFAPDEVAATQHAIAAHSFSAGVPPETIEARILQDADRLEAFGAIGIARTFHIAGQMGSALFDGDDPFAERRPLDDRRFALDHFAVKLLKLPGTMQTEGGRAFAVERVVAMRAFLKALGDELGHATPW
jgi:uncharacterized protein